MLTSGRWWPIRMTWLKDKGTGTEHRRRGRATCARLLAGKRYPLPNSNAADIEHHQLGAATEGGRIRARRNDDTQMCSPLFVCRSERAVL